MPSLIITDQRVLSAAFAYTGCTNWLTMVYRQHVSSKVVASMLGKDRSLYDRLSFPNQQLYTRPVVMPNNVRNNKMTTVPLDSEMERRAAKVLNDPSYFKFAVVRHPWQRLVSAYKNKYVEICNSNRKCFNRMYGFKINELTTKTLTLDEILVWLLESDMAVTNLHFRPCATLCEVDRIKYDFIGDLETEAHDKYIVRAMNSTIPLNPAYQSQAHASIRSEPVECSAKTVGLAERFYAADLHAFGYTMQAALDSCTKYGQAFPPVQ